MTKKTVALALLATTLVSIPATASDKEDSWIAENPYKGKNYAKEEVSTFAKGVNKTATIVWGLGSLGFAADYVIKNWALESVPCNVPLVNTATSLLLPTLNSVGQTSLAISALMLIGIPTNIAVTYGAKKGAQGVEFVAKKGWKAVTFGFDTASYFWNNFRAEYMQGTFYENSSVTYVTSQKN